MTQRFNHAWYDLYRIKREIPESPTMPVIVVALVTSGPPHRWPHISSTQIIMMPFIQSKCTPVSVRKEVAQSESRNVSKLSGHGNSWPCPNQSRPQTIRKVSDRMFEGGTSVPEISLFLHQRDVDSIQSRLDELNGVKRSGDRRHTCDRTWVA